VSDCRGGHATSRKLRDVGRPPIKGMQYPCRLGIGRGQRVDDGRVLCQNKRASLMRSESHQAMKNSLTLYLHFPCFDGLVSAVLASEYLDQKLGWKTECLKPVGYGLRDTWLRSPLEKPAAVVDFLFHPDADFWADHHATSFSSEEIRQNVLRKRNEFFLYDPKSLSCSSLLWRRLGRDFLDPRFDRPPNS
jgi:hypothetical protein